MQNKIVNFNNTKEAKLEVLDSAWNQLLFKLQNVHTEVKDKWTNEIIRQILRIEPEIKKACLVEFLQSC